MAARRVPFAQAHSWGNDFLLMRETEGAGASRGALARAVCDRHTSLGAEGLVVLGPSLTAPAAFQLPGGAGDSG